MSDVRHDNTGLTGYLRKLPRQERATLLLKIARRWGRIVREFREVNQGAGFYEWQSHVIVGRKTNGRRKKKARAETLGDLGFPWQPAGDRPHEDGDAADGRAEGGQEEVRPPAG